MLQIRHLSILFLFCNSLWGAGVSATIGGPPCGTTGVPLVSVSAFGTPTANLIFHYDACSLATLTMTGTDFSFDGTSGNWTASASITSDLVEAGYAIAAALFSPPPAVILGGSGVGFYRVQITDAVDSGNLYWPYSNVESMTAGDLHYQFDRFNRPVNTARVTLSETRWSEFIPFSFGTPVDLPPDTDGIVSFNILYIQSAPHSFATHTISNFDIRDAEMNPVLGAFAVPAPEPGGFLLCGVAGLLLLLFGRRQFRGGAFWRSHSAP